MGRSPWFLPVLLIACGGEPKTPDQVQTARTEPVPTQQTAAADPKACDDDHACPSGDKCQNGHCVTPPNGGPGCTDFPPPHFIFESAELQHDGRAVLDRLSTCLLTGGLKSKKVLLVGHCDAKGEYEFNMGLGAERAETIKNYLIGKLVPADRIGTSSRGKLDASGTDEASAADDRRVDIEIR
jgi:outer membrane protein OmpA-like peptidoglycan-associated protein